MEVLEMYITQSSVSKSIFMLIILSGGDANLYWYCGDSKLKENNTRLTKRNDNTIVIEYGDKNILGTPKTLELTDDKGNLLPNWQKIK